MFKNKNENNVKEFPQELSQVILDGQKHGVGDELMVKGMISVGNLMGRFVTPDSPEEALMKEMWEIADEIEKTPIARVVLKMGKSKLGNKC